MGVACWRHQGDTRDFWPAGPRPNNSAPPSSQGELRPVARVQPGGGAEHRAPPQDGRSPLRTEAPNPAGPGGGEPMWLLPIQNLESGGDRKSPKLKQVSWKSGKEASKLSAMQNPGCRQLSVLSPLIQVLPLTFPRSAQAWIRLHLLPIHLRWLRTDRDAR